MDAKDGKMDKISNQRHGRRTILAGAGAALGLGGFAAALPGQLTPAGDMAPRIVSNPARSATLPNRSSAARAIDADLLQACADHTVAWRGYCAAPDDVSTDPFYEAINRARDKIDAAPPQTFVGLVAKVQAAKLEATQPDGGQEWGDGFVATWVPQIIDDLLRLSGGAT
jgi:hypothetical protein